MSERKIYKLAKELGYTVRKGFMHYIYNNSVFKDENGNRISGYIVEDDDTGFAVWGSYNECFDFLWTLQDVENFLKSVKVR